MAGAPAAAFLLAAIVGACELAVRYRAAPLKALASWPTTAYVVVNGVGGAAAVALARIFGLSDGGNQAALVVAASFSAVALLRVTFNGAPDDAATPGALLARLLRACDEAVRKEVAAYRVAASSALMAGIAFSRAVDLLPALCGAAGGAPTDASEEDLIELVAGLEAADGPDETKAVIFGVGLIRVYGVGTVEAAIAAQRQSIAERRSGPDRRSGQDRRCREQAPMEDLRRTGSERRRSTDRRSRRTPELASP